MQLQVKFLLVKMSICKPNVLSTIYCKANVFSLTKRSLGTAGGRAVKDAEKLVGYPTSFLSLRWLLSDEVANIATHIRKLIGTNHPLLATARELIIGERTPSWGLLVLLVSKAGGLGKHFSDMDKDVTAGILHSQRVLAEITEMIRTSNILHTSILNIYGKNTENYPELSFGNSLSLLTGDYLLSNSFHELAGLKNQEVNEIVSMCLRDLCEATFIEPRDKQSRPLPSKPLEQIAGADDIDVPIEISCKPLNPQQFLGKAKAEWILRHYWGNGSLLANNCFAALKLADHSEDFQKLGFHFGKNMALAYQAHFDLKSFYNLEAEYFSLVSAPVLFHLQYDPSFYSEILKGSNDIHDCDYAKIRHVIMNHGPAIEKTEHLKSKFAKKSLEILQNFKENESRKALESLIRIL